MDNNMILKEGKYTIEQIAKLKGIKKQSAINLISNLKKKHLVSTSGGGTEKRIYTIYKLPHKKTNGFFDVVNKYSPEKLVPEFEHFVHGNYSIEHAIIDGIKLNNMRARESIKYLFKHIKNWKRLFDLAKEHNLVDDVRKIYEESRVKFKCKKMPKKYIQ